MSERLEDAIRDMLDYAVGWTGPMTADERLAAIERIGKAALTQGETSDEA